MFTRVGDLKVLWKKMKLKLAIAKRLSTFNQGFFI